MKMNDIDDLKSKNNELKKNIDFFKEKIRRIKKTQGSVIHDLLLEGVISITEENELRKKIPFKESEFNQLLDGYNIKETGIWKEYTDNQILFRILKERYENLNT